MHSENMKLNKLNVSKSEVESIRGC